MNLETLLEKAKAGQWAISDFDWETPLAQGDEISRGRRRLLGKVLLFTAGVEKLGAHAFRIDAQNSVHPTLRELFEITAADEDRHSEAEVLLARRLGVEWDDLPRPTRAFFKTVTRDLLSVRGVRSQLFYELIGTQIILFELALDAILTPTLKEMIADPFQEEIIRMIELDESRHLALDYWLLENMGTRDLQATPRGSDVLFHFPLRISSLAAAGVGFGTFFYDVRALRLKSERFGDYWRRVRAIPKKSPHAGDFRPHRNTVGFIQKSINTTKEIVSAVS